MAAVICKWTLAEKTIEIPQRSIDCPGTQVDRSRVCERKRNHTSTLPAGDDGRARTSPRSRTFRDLRADNSNARLSPHEVTHCSSRLSNETRRTTKLRRTQLRPEAAKTLR